MIPLFKVFMSAGVEREVARVLRSGYVAEGPEVERFEAALRRFLRSRREVLATNSCTSALQLALHLAGVSPGDEVVSTPMTCTATNSAVLNSGARIVWADVEPRTGNIDPESVASKLSNRTKAIMAVDWAGRPCDYGSLRPLSTVIQDAAHSFGATLGGGSLADQGGHYLCFSFQAIKHLTTGDGGALLVPVGVEERARKLRWFGLDRRSGADFRNAQLIEEAGFKYHMNDIAAAIGLVNLEEIDDVLQRHRANARRLHDALAGLENVQRVPWSDDSSWWVYTLLVPERAAFVSHMKAQGIAVSEVHARNDRHPIFPDAPDADYPGLADFARRQIAIPCGWWLSDADLEVIVQAVRSWHP